MVDNSENTAWNDLHNNNRCPINDTGVDGAPVALGGFNPNWANGSINQALNSTWTINNGVVEAEDQENFDGLIMDLKQCGSYVFQDMLYGYLGDSVGQSPGDMMSYRAYPTPVISTETWSRADVASLVGYLPDGTKLVTAGQFIIMNYEASISRYLPFDIVWEVKVNTTQGDPSPIAYEVKIASGASVITHTRFVGDTEWLPATAGKVWTSSDSSSFTGDVTMSSVPSNFAQAPYYGTLETNDEVITQVEYEDVPAATNGEFYESNFYESGFYTGGTAPSATKYVFDGTANSWFELDQNDMLNDVVAQSWVIKGKITASGVNASFIGQSTSGVNLRFGVTSTDTFRWRLNNSNVSGSSFDDNEHIYIATYDGTFMKVYQDGVEMLSSNDPDWTGSADGRTAAIGRSSSSMVFVGEQEEVQFYNKALSQSEIDDLQIDLSDTATGLVARFAGQKTASTWTSEVNGYTATNQGGVTLV